MWPLRVSVSVPRVSHRWWTRLNTDLLSVLHTGTQWLHRRKRRLCRVLVVLLTRLHHHDLQLLPN